MPAPIRPPRVRIKDPDAGSINRALDGIDVALARAESRIAGRVPVPTAPISIRFVSGSTNVSQAQRDGWLLIVPNPSLVIGVPGVPTEGTTFGIKNITTGTQALRIDAGTSRMEDPMRPGTVVTGSFAVSGSGLAVRWSWLGRGEDAAWWVTDRSRGGT